MTQGTPWSRRNFLTGRGLGASTGGMIAALLPDPPMLLADDDRSVQHWTISRRAMACEFTVHLHPLTQDPLTVADAALREIEAVEDLLTVYRPDSEMSRVNAEACHRPVRVSERLFAILKLAAQLHEKTDGAFDVATGALIKAWGFYDGTRRVPTPSEHAAAMASSGMQHVELNEAERTVRYQVPGLQINLGSIGKGYAIDQALRRLRAEFGTECALIGGGTSSMYGCGSLWGDESGWLIGIEDPTDPGRRVASVHLRNRALGTSNAAKQSFEHNAKRFGHLLDPRTGRPADGIAGVSVLAPDAATADALATAFFVMGLDKTAAFCHNHPDIAALVVLKPDQETTIAALDEGRGGDGPANRQLKRLSERVITLNLLPHDVKVKSAERRDTTPPA